MGTIIGFIPKKEKVSKKETEKELAKKENDEGKKVDNAEHSKKETEE